MPRYTLTRARTAAVLIATAALTSAATAQPTTEDEMLTPSDAMELHFFGASVAMDEGLIAVAATWDGETDVNAGAVYLFDAASGTELRKLRATDGARNDNLGNALALDGGLLVAGARAADPNGSGSGAAYLFDTSTGAQLHKLIAADGDSGDRFGTSVAIGDGLVVIGADGDEDPNPFNGSAYVFDAATGTQLFRLTADDEDQVLGGTFGFSVAVGDGIIAVGAPDFDTNLLSGGTVFVFDAATGEEIRQIEPGDAEEFDQFGRRVAIDDGMLAVSAPFKHEGRGQIYLYDTENLSLQQTLTVDDAQEDEEMGESLDLDGGMIVAGAPGEATNGFAAGAAYVFDTATGDLAATLLPSDGEVNDELGFAMAIDGGAVVAGVDQDEPNGDFSGSAYVFSVGGGNACGDADLADPLGVLDLADINAFVGAFAAQDNAADLTGDGLWDLSDITAFVGAFNAGCP